MVECRTGAAEMEEREAVIGYVRNEAPHGRFDVREQAAVIVRLCARRDWDLVSIVYEGGPAKGRSLNRPGLSGALQRLGAGEVTCLVTTDVRNLCRSVAEVGGVLEVIDHAGARLVSLDPPIDTATQAGRVGARILSSVSEWERTRSIERSRRGLAAARKQGALRTIEPELKRQITRMRSSGMTLQAIVDELNAAGVPTVRGGSTWRPSSVQAAIGYKRPARIV